MRGFSFIEILTVLSVISLLGALATPPCLKYYGSFCVKAAANDIVNLMKEGKMRSLEGTDHALFFSSEEQSVTLVSGKGADNRWGTSDDMVLRSLRLRDKGGGLRFGYGSYGPVYGLTAAPDGISFTNNRLFFNDELTGTAGTIYLISSSGAAMAIVLDTRDAGCDIYWWNGRNWIKQ